MAKNYENESTKRIADAIGAWVQKDGSLHYLAGKLSMTDHELIIRLGGMKEWMWDEVVVIAQTIGCTLEELAGSAASSTGYLSISP